MPAPFAVDLDIGPRILRRLMWKHAHMTQDYIAGYLGCSQQHVSNIVKGKAPLEVGTALALAADSGDLEVMLAPEIVGLGYDLVRKPQSEADLAGILRQMPIPLAQALAALLEFTSPSSDGGHDVTPSELQEALPLLATVEQACAEIRRGAASNTAKVKVVS